MSRECIRMRERHEPYNISAISYLLADSIPSTTNVNPESSLTPVKVALLGVKRPRRKNVVLLSLLQWRVFGLLFAGRCNGSFLLDVFVIGSRSISLLRRLQYVITIGEKMRVVQVSPW